MPARSFARMTVQELLELRDQVGAQLEKKRAQLEAEIEQISGGGDAAGREQRSGRVGHVLKGRKVPPKYRGPKGETWAGRGATPRWLAELMKQGRKKEEFAIGGAASKSATVKRKKRLVKRARRKK